MAFNRRPVAAHVLAGDAAAQPPAQVLQLINGMVDWRHVVVTPGGLPEAFKGGIGNPFVRCVRLDPSPGGWRSEHAALVRELERLAPAVVHTHQPAALRAQIAAWQAGRPVRIHGEHAGEALEPDGRMSRPTWLRRVHRPFVQHWVAPTLDLEHYLRRRVGVSASRVARIDRGVDTRQFSPASPRPPIGGSPFADADLVLCGAIGRLQAQSGLPLLAEAFVQARQRERSLTASLRLVLLGSGEPLVRCEEILRAAGVRELAWLPGERTDAAAVLRGLDFFVLPSLASDPEGHALEAMACGLPVIATRKGASAEPAEDGVSGEVVPAGDVSALADALVRWATDATRRARAGAAGRELVMQRFSLAAMAFSYQTLYEKLLVKAGLPF